MFDQNKTLVRKIKKRSNPELLPEAFFDEICGTVGDLLTEQKITTEQLRGIGIGMPSYIPFEEGRIVKTTNLTKIHDFPARAYMMNRLENVRIILDNDLHTGVF